MGENIGNQLSAVEAELYDRQIRLWGIESQEKLRASNVLLIGIRALGSEIAKNILLSGINSLTILDDGVVTKEEQVKNFLLYPDSIGKKIADEVLLKGRALNPLVKIKVDTDSPASKDQSFFKKFTIIIATGIKTDLLLKIDKICRANNVKLIFGDVFGFFGYSVADFQEHNYFEDQVQLTGKGKKRKHDGEEKTTVKVQGTINYPELKKVIILPNTKQNADCIKKTKRRNDLFFLMLTLIEFRNKHNRHPLVSSKVEDIKSLQAIRKDVFELYQVDQSKSSLFDDLFEIIFDEVVPVCAILGGVIAQEAIKAVSHKEVPINNVFLFDPISYDGKEETIGA
ncbi:SUMO1 activating enzyme subunit 1 [Leptinotarsa decemlineata]|uniref:SUMO1 activating enzyme subunit 1 n=1 Tax=Leptinotarsa decemlineata TaxID=7539 RepID=UPI000C254742|nr:SUMO-activating enzyme subunit 1-like [Leptinotarsa decemlineata]